MKLFAVLDTHTNTLVRHSYNGPVRLYTRKGDATAWMNISNKRRNSAIAGDPYTEQDSFVVVTTDTDWKPVE